MNITEYYESLWTEEAEAEAQRRMLSVEKHNAKNGYIIPTESELFGIDISDELADAEEYAEIDF